MLLINVLRISFISFLVWLVPCAVAQMHQGCTLTCGNPIDPAEGPARGPPGPPGPPGKVGPPGDVLQCNCSSMHSATRRISELEDTIRNLASFKQAPNPLRSDCRSCKDIKLADPSSSDGVYELRSESGYKYQVYCDMQTEGGGWTLVASVHENNMREGGGRCTRGDRWSTEQGWKKKGNHGDGNWENWNTFGHFASATSDDYKSPAYFELQAENLMIWHTPNGTPLVQYNTSSYLKYRTTNGFLSQYGGNLRSLYADRYPIVSQTYSYPADNGPSPPVVFDRGSSAELSQLLPPNLKVHVDVGYIQVRPISYNQNAYAICPGTRMKSTFGYPSQACLGSSGYTFFETYCGDFSGLLHDGNVPGEGWSAQKKLLESTFLFFYK